jgi:23S rRNA (cytosine1962-C5)-methyltransferase
MSPSPAERRAIWPDFDAARILYEDESVIAIDKPSGVPSQASTEEARDDVVERLRNHLAAREGVDAKRVYLGAHQRLDRATSGVLIYAKKKEANRSLASQFEGRAVDKRYLACVAHFAKGPKSRTLRHRLAPGDDGRMVVVPARDRRGQDAVTHIEELERRGDRALLELRLETGRTHQARAQLAAAHAPIAGDRLYTVHGDADAAAAAPRLMLHARSIALRHPMTDRPLVVSAEPPRAFARWLEQGDRSPLAGDDSALVDAIELAREDRFALGRSGDTTAFRLLNEGGDGVPGVAVDVYGDHLVAHFYDDDAIRAEERVLDALSSLGFSGVYVKRRPKQANTLVDTRTEALAPPRPVRGTPADDEIEIREHGLPYLARLGDGLSTGIFLDQRENRRRVRELSGGKRVLNLFAYTCPFTVAAAAGGASRTVSVDASRPAIDRGAHALEHAGLAGDHHELLVEDVYAYLERAKKKGERFDLVILDPPSYSSVGASRFSTSSDYRPLAAQAMALVSPGGRLLACSNHRQTVRAKLRRWLHEAAREAGREVTQMKDHPAPIDFPPPWGFEHHLKSVLVRLA